MSNYSLGKIYKLFIRGLEEVCYVGSTTNTLSERLCLHRHQAKNDEQNKCASSCLFEEGNEVVIELLEDYPCNSKRELEERERFWLSKFPEAINKNIPTRGWQERWVQNRDHNLEKHREWLEAHKEEEAEKKKQRRLADLESARAKEKDANARRDKTKRNEWKNVKVSCSECGLVLSRNNFPTHKKNKHEGKEVTYTVL